VQVSRGRAAAATGCSALRRGSAATTNLSLRRRMLSPIQPALRTADVGLCNRRLQQRTAFSRFGTLAKLCRNVRSLQIPLKKPSSIPSDREARRVSGTVGRVVWAAPGPPSRALCGQHFGKHIDRSEAGESSQVLGGGGKEKLVLSSVWSSQTQTRQTKDSLEMGEQHLDFLSPATRLHVLRSCACARATSRASSCRSRGILRARAFGQHCGLSLQVSQSNLLAR
jgi:hypothetical protein